MPCECRKMCDNCKKVNLTNIIKELEKIDENYMRIRKELLAMKDVHESELKKAEELRIERENETQEEFTARQMGR